MIPPPWPPAMIPPAAADGKAMIPVAAHAPDAALAPGSGSLTPAKDPLLFY
jgi:hypothetical protein